MDCPHLYDPKHAFSDVFLVPTLAIMYRETTTIGFDSEGCNATFDEVSKFDVTSGANKNPISFLSYFVVITGEEMNFENILKEVSTFLTYYILLPLRVMITIITETIPELKNLLNEKTEAQRSDPSNLKLESEISTLNASLVGWEKILDDYNTTNSRAFNEGLENAGRCHVFFSLSNIL